MCYCENRIDIFRNRVYAVCIATRGGTAMKNDEEYTGELLEGEVLDAADHVGEGADHPKRMPTGKAKKYSLSSESIVTKSNDLIQKTRYSLPKTQQKVLLAMIAQIDPKHDFDPSKVYSMSFSDFSKLTGVNMHNKSYYDFLKKTIKSLSDSSFWMEDKSKTSRKEKLIRWIGEETEINRDEQMIYMQFSKRIFPYLTQLKSNYTSFNVQYLLQMNSTYSMRFYEILLSYDNGDRDYHYANNLVFQPVNDEVLDMFPDKGAALRGYKYKVYNIDDLKEQLSPPPPDDESEAGSKKYKPLTEKYPNFNDFERYVLMKAKEEINEMTDLWFDYVPVRMRGTRKYDRLYLFIKYKTEAEMESVRKRHAGKRKPGEEVPRKPRTRKAKAAEEPQVPVGEPLPETIHDLTTTKALRMLEVKAELTALQSQARPDVLEAAAAVLGYLAKALTNTKSAKGQRVSVETREALNRVLEKNGTLKVWVLGMARMMLDKQAAGQLKSPQYNTSVVVNAIEDMTILPMGKEELRQSGAKDLFAPDMAVFDEE